MESNLKVIIRARATVSPSEDRAKVRTAVLNVLGDCATSTEAGNDEVAISSEDVRCLQKMRDQLRDRRVRDTARRLMLAQREGDTLRMLLNRQAAFAGVISLCTRDTESPLGPITMEIECARSDELIDWLTAH